MNQFIVKLFTLIINDVFSDISIKPCCRKNEKKIWRNVKQNVLYQNEIKQIDNVIL